MVQMSSEALRNNLSNPQRTYLWDFIIPNPIAGGDRDVLQLRCQSTSLPGRSFGSILVNYKQSAGVKYPGKLAYSHSWDCTFIEGEDAKIFDAIYDWKQQIVNDLTNTGISDLLIKTDAILKLVDRAGTVTRKIKIIGIYPEALPDVPLDYNSEGNLMLPVTWSFDRWEDIS